MSQDRIVALGGILVGACALVWALGYRTGVERAIDKFDRPRPRIYDVRWCGADGGVDGR